MLYYSILSQNILCVKEYMNSFMVTAPLVDEINVHSRDKLFTCQSHAMNGTLF